MISRFKLARAGVALGVVALAFAAMCEIAVSRQAEKETSASASRPIAHKISTPGISNFGEVTPLLYRGAQPSQDGFNSLKKLGVDIVVDLRDGNRDGEAKTVKGLGMKYVSIPSQCYAPNDDIFARFLAVVRENPGKKVFVHCKLGKDRTGMAIASYRMAKQGWSADEAMKEMQSFGFTASHHMTCPGLAGYEKDFPAHLKTGTAFQEPRQQDSSATK